MPKPRPKRSHRKPKQHHKDKGSTVLHQDSSYAALNMANHTINSFYAFSEEAIQRQLNYPIPISDPYYASKNEVMHYYRLYDIPHFSDFDAYGSAQTPTRLSPHSPCFTPRAPVSHRADTVEEDKWKVVGYVEGYHHPILRHQTRAWWERFGYDLDPRYLLNTSYASPSAGVEVCQPPLDWCVERYFAPCSVDAERIEGWCEGVGRVLGECAGVDGKEWKGCRGRDDWECDFCGMECFCWTVGLGR